MTRAELSDRFVELYPALRSQLRWRLGSQELADEALHETWLRLSAGGDLGVIQNAKSYLARMAMNIAIDRRRAGAKLASALEIEAALAAPDPAPGPEQATAARLELTTLEAALATLPARRRAILFAARIEGKSCRLIAEEMRLSTRTVEMELRHALDHCAEHLAAAERTASRGGRSNRLENGG